MGIRSNLARSQTRVPSVATPSHAPQYPGWGRSKTKTERFFGGEGIIVRRPSDDPTGGSITVVETEHAAQVSELIFALRDVFAGSID
jgi:hypothetical protein